MANILKIIVICNIICGIFSMMMMFAAMALFEVAAVMMMVALVEAAVAPMLENG